MKRQPFPVRVAMPPAAVPGLIETNSRTMLAAPSSRVLGSPRYLRSCGTAPQPPRRARSPARHLEPQRVARHRGTPEAGAVDRDQMQLLRLLAGEVGPELHESLADEHAGQHRGAREVADEVGLVGGHELGP